MSEDFQIVKKNHFLANDVPEMSNFASQLMLLLKQDILNGVFKPNEKLVMAKLKKHYNVGTSPLREALSQLLIEQLVVVEDQRGFRVHPISRGEMMDLYHTRAHIEALCIVQAIERGSIDWEAEVLAAMHRMKKSKYLIEQGIDGLIQWEAKHQAFHLAIAAGCQSPTLLHVRQSLYERTSRYRLFWLRNHMVADSYFEKNRKEHEALLESVLNRDSELASKTMFNHLHSPRIALDNLFSTNYPAQ